MEAVKQGGAAIGCKVRIYELYTDDERIFIFPVAVSLSTTFQI